MPSKPRSEIYGDLLPLREPTFFILLALSPQPKHGYAILKDVERLSEGRVQLSTGTLYGALARLLEQAVIQPSAGISDQESALLDDQQGGRPRRYYELTAFGRRLLSQEVTRLSALVALAHRQLGPQGG